MVKQKLEDLGVANFGGVGFSGCGQSGWIAMDERGRPIDPGATPVCFFESREKGEVFQPGGVIFLELGQAGFERGGSPASKGLGSFLENGATSKEDGSVLDL